MDPLRRTKLDRIFRNKKLPFRIQQASSGGSPSTQWRDFRSDALDQTPGLYDAWLTNRYELRPNLQLVQACKDVIKT